MSAAPRLKVEIAFGQAPGVFGNQNRSRRCHLFHAGGEVCRVPYWHVVRMQIIFANGADHDFARVDPHPHIQRHPPLEAQLVTIPAYVFLHPQSGVQGTLGMIFMGNGRPEQGKDAISQGLGHIAVIAMDGVHHQLQCGVDNGPGLFGVESFNQGG